MLITIMFTATDIIYKRTYFDALEYLSKRLGLSPKFLHAQLSELMFEEAEFSQRSIWIDREDGDINVMRSETYQIAPFPVATRK